MKVLKHGHTAEYRKACIYSLSAFSTALPRILFKIRETPSHADSMENITLLLPLSMWKICSHPTSTAAAFLSHCIQNSLGPWSSVCCTSRLPHFPAISVRRIYCNLLNRAISMSPLLPTCRGSSTHAPGKLAQSYGSFSSPYKLSICIAALKSLYTAK